MDFPPGEQTLNTAIARTLTHLKAHPGSTVAQVSEATGTCKKTVQDILNDLMASAEVEKIIQAGLMAVYFLRTASPLEQRLNDARQTALALEGKKLWHRAARQWLVAFDIARQVHDREEIARRREKCIRHARASVPAGYFE